jgi:hypothetical protein
MLAQKLAAAEKEATDSDSSEEQTPEELNKSKIATHLAIQKLKSKHGIVRCQHGQAAPETKRPRKALTKAIDHEEGVNEEDEAMEERSRILEEQYN